MTMAAVIESRTAQAPARQLPAGIARIDIVSDLAAAEPVWRALETSDHVSTPYQRFDLLGAWQRDVGAREQAVPFIVIARDAEQRPLLLLPLALRRAFGVRVATFMGGKHTTFNMPLMDRDFAARASAGDLDALLAGLRDHGGADVLALFQQPKHWRDLDNPFARWPHQPSVNDCPVLLMPQGAAPTALLSNSFRKRLKSKEKKLQALPGYRYVVASRDDEIAELLDWFFLTKPVRMAEQKLPNVFAEPGIEAFVRHACMAKLGCGHRVIEIHALRCDDEIIALFAGVADGARFSMMFNTYTLSENARWSPGLILMRSIIDHYAREDFRALDLGIGSDGYKRMFCKDDEPIFDSFVPLTARGRVAAAAMGAVGRAKHAVKHSPALFRLAQRLRGALQPRTATAASDGKAED
ncbi:GNAT family N-acetyltransferase [Bradyrhizobium aeschynomenes]|uniref:GNAT family N-acetyltransferase n=1 Tax=Bradyrhizobium aeschynomenes TaxID=2734909 RepID=UPI001552C38D|nr:GNAT family N-acetyltransferase [Bradyrhizobium aeschynomenes]NPV22503.1 GNAT family N-acetyltransferase [Bradyrhizobium aeschynomenes]